MEEGTEMQEQKTVKIEDIKFFPKNARVHRKKNLDAIRDSLSKFGQVEPLVVQKSTSFVLGGNGRLEAMRSLGWKEANCVLLDLNDKDALALSVALNRTSELSEWDIESLQEVMSFVKDDKDLLPGWSEDELAAMLSTTWEVEELGEVLNEDEDAGDIGDLETVDPPSQTPSSSTNTIETAAPPEEVGSVPNTQEPDYSASVTEVALMFGQQDNLEEFVDVCIRVATQSVLDKDGLSSDEKWDILKGKL